MKRILLSTLALAMCFSLVCNAADAKPRSGSSWSVSTDGDSWLGVYTQSVDEDLADAFEIDVDYGAIVNEVINDSPADKANLKNGDVIVSFNGRKVWDQRDLIDFIDDTEPGTTVEIGILRKGKEMTLSAELGKRPNTTAVVPDGRGSSNSYSFEFPADDDNGVRVFSRFHGGYVGIQMSDMSKQLADYFGLKNGKGALITEVVEDSPAEKAGLKAGDVITKIGDETVGDYADVKEIVSGSDKGDQLSFIIVRNKKTQSVKVEVAENNLDDHAFGLFSVPPVPDIDIRTPRSRGRLNYDDGNAYFDYDNYKESMEKFRADMEKYKEDMRQLSKEMKKFKVDDKSALEDQIKELKQQIRELERKLQ